MYLFIPYLDKNSGYGHFLRCMWLALYMKGEILLKKDQYDIVATIIADFKEKHDCAHISFVETPAIEYRGVIVDKKTVDAHFAYNFLKYGPVLGIDCGGEGRACMPYLIDVLPNTIAHAANQTLCGIPYTRRAHANAVWPQKCVKALFYTNRIINEQEMTFFSRVATMDITLTIVTNKFHEYSRALSHYHNIPVVRFAIDFSSLIRAHDVCISHFGVSVFEALAERVPVVVLNDSRYHHMLSVQAGFPKIFFHSESFSRTKPDIRSRSTKHNGYRLLCDYLASLKTDNERYLKLVADCKTLVDTKYATSLYNQEINLADTITDVFNNYHLSVAYGRSAVPLNPWLGHITERAVFRNKDKTVYYCDETKQWFQIPFSAYFPTYGNDYFFSQYKEQYGKSYLEDFDSVLRVMRKRVGHIVHMYEKYLKLFKRINADVFPLVQQLCNRNNSRAPIVHSATETALPMLCDLGSAYGAMLLASQEKGFAPLGMDVSEEAVAYCKNTLHCNAIATDISNHPMRELLRKHGVDTHTLIVLTAYYFIEHVPNIQKLLDDVHTILPLYGMLSCSVPNGNGISARKNRALFFQQSSIDHFSIFTPKGLTLLLEKSGFKTIKIKITGHHPARFGWPKMFHGILRIISILFNLGDTFEIYAIKIW